MIRTTKIRPSFALRLRSLSVLVILQFGLVSLVSAQAIHVAVYDDLGAGRSKEDLVRVLRSTDGVYFQRLSAADFQRRDLSQFDVIICPGGSGSKQGKQLAESGRERIRKFVANGGSFMGICAGAYLASADYDWSLHLLDARVVDRKHWARGTGTVQLGITSIGQTLFDCDANLEIFYGQGPLLAPAGRDDLPDFEPLARYQSEINRNGAPQGVMLGTTAIAVGSFGKGQVICFSPHPEKTDGREAMIGKALHFLAPERGQQKSASVSMSVADITSDISQKGMPNSNYCAPCAVTNLISQFEHRGKLPTRSTYEQLALRLGDSDHMETLDRNGTNRFRLVNGLHRWLDENAPGKKLQVEYTGLRLYDESKLDPSLRENVIAQIGPPRIGHIARALSQGKGVAILFGSYRVDTATGTLIRLGGHYVAVVGIETNANGTTVVLHDSNDGLTGGKLVTAKPPTETILLSDEEVLADKQRVVQLENAPIRKDGRIAFLETVFAFDVSEL